MATLNELLEQRVGCVRAENWPAGQYLELQYEPRLRAVLHSGPGRMREINLVQLVKESAHLNYSEVTGADP